MIGVRVSIFRARLAAGLCNFKQRVRKGFRNGFQMAELLAGSWDCLWGLDTRSALSEARLHEFTTGLGGSCLDLGQYTFRRTLIERPQMATKVYRPKPSLQALLFKNVLA